LSKIPYPIILHQLYFALPKEDRTIPKARVLLNSWIDKIHSDLRVNFRQALKKLSEMNNSQNFLEDMDIFEHPSVKAADSNSSILCIFLKAASQFFEKNKYLPQPTRLPDMETNTELFVQLKTVYKQ